jgi:nitrogen fixation NifU-like protein
MKGKNPSCGDEITIELQVEGGIVKEAAFTGIGCAISQASTDIMAELIRGKSVEDARRLANKFISMIKGELVDEDELEELDEALALKNVAHMPARVKCAVLAWHTLDDALKDQK